MKKNIAIILLVFIGIVPAMSQSHGRHNKKHREITELVSDLSQNQKKKIDGIRKESKTKVLALRAQQKAVRDSIVSLMELEGDQSTALYPLFNREAELQVAVSREMYSTKLKIDEVLTKEQRAELRTACKKDGKPRNKTKE